MGRDDADLIIVPCLQAIRQRGVGFIRCQKKLGRERLGGLVYFRKEVPVFMKIFPHRVDAAVSLFKDFDLFAVRQRVRVGIKPNAHFAMAGIESQKRLGDVRVGVDHILHIILSDRARVEDRIPQRLHQFGCKTRIRGAANIAQIEIIHLGECHEQFCADRSLIAFDQIDIACRDVEIFSHLGLGQAQCAAQASQLCANQKFFFSLTHKPIRNLQKLQDVCSTRYIINKKTQ